jgi:GT2 family glycosyltransferase
MLIPIFFDCMQHSISVLIPNYNGKKLLEENLPSVYTALHNYPFLFSEIIVSDDASADDSLLFVKQQFPEVKCVSTEVNTGFSGAVNRGISECSGDLILILNSDVQLSATYFDTQISLFEDLEVFGVMGTISSKDGTQIQDTAKYPSFSGGKIGSTLNYRTQEKGSWPTLFLSGANALVRKSYLVQLKGFNEIFNPYYCEDVDLGIRAWRAGWKCLFESTAICYHPNSETIKKQGKEKVRRISRRNKAILHLMHLEGMYLLWYKWMLRLKSVLWQLVGSKKYTQVVEDISALKPLIQENRQQLSILPYRYSLLEIMDKIRKNMPQKIQIF